MCRVTWKEKRDEFRLKNRRKAGTTLVTRSMLKEKVDHLRAALAVENLLLRRKGKSDDFSNLLKPLFASANGVQIKAPCCQEFDVKCSRGNSGKHKAQTIITIIIICICAETKSIWFFMSFAFKQTRINNNAVLSKRHYCSPSLCT